MTKNEKQLAIANQIITQARDIQASLKKINLLQKKTARIFRKIPTGRKLVATEYAMLFFNCMHHRTHLYTLISQPVAKNLSNGIISERGPEMIHMPHNKLHDLSELRMLRAKKIAKPLPKPLLITNTRDLIPTSTKRKISRS